MTQKPELWVVRAGQIPYLDARDEQKRLEAARSAGEIPDLLLILEHPPVYTKGRRSEPGHLPMGEDWYRMQGIEVAETDRGGQVTYHGPGQLVAYPIIDLAAYDHDVHSFVRRLEEVMIATLGDVGIPAQVFSGLTGVWTAGEPPITPGEVGPQKTPVGEGTLAGATARKIGSIGIHVNKGITTHGLAINVANDLQPFEWIVPCAIEHVQMTSVGRELGTEPDMSAFASTLVRRFAEVFERKAVEVEVSRLQGGARVNYEEAHVYAREKGVSRRLYAVIRLLVIPIMRLVWGLRIEGAENVPTEGAAIITPNHKSFFDSFFLAAGTKRHLRFMGKSELFEGRKGKLLIGLGAFPVQRGSSDTEAMETARVILAQGGLLSLFPEGTRVRDPGELGPPKRGAVRLALESGAPLIPAAITGTEKLFIGPFPRPRTVRVAFGEKVPVDQMPATPEAAGEVLDDHLWPQVEEEFGRLRAHPGLIAAGLAAAGIGAGIAVKRKSSGSKRKRRR